MEDVEIMWAVRRFAKLADKGGPKLLARICTVRWVEGTLYISLVLLPINSSNVLVLLISASYQVIV